MSISDTPIRDLMKTFVPEANNQDDDVLDIFLELATSQTSKQVFGTSYRPAICYLAGHYLILTTERSGVAGPITGRRAGEVSENYGMTRIDESGLNDTSYGRIYKSFLRRSPHVSPTTSYSDG